MPEQLDLQMVSGEQPATHIDDPPPPYEGSTSTTIHKTGDHDGQLAAAPAKPQPQVDDSELYPNKIWVDPNVTVLKGDVVSLYHALLQHPEGLNFIAILETPNGQLQDAGPFSSLVRELIRRGNTELSGKIALAFPYDKANKAAYRELGSSDLCFKWATSIHLYHVDAMERHKKDTTEDMLNQFKDQFGPESYYLNLRSLFISCTWPDAPTWLYAGAHKLYSEEMVKWAPGLKRICIGFGREPMPLDNSPVWWSCKEKNKSDWMSHCDVNIVFEISYDEVQSSQGQSPSHEESSPQEESQCIED